MRYFEWQKIVIGVLVCVVALNAKADKQQSYSYPEKLVFADSQPPDSKLFRWMELVYTELFSRMNIDVRFEHMPSARATSQIELGVFDGQIRRVMLYENQVKNQIRVPESLYSLKMIAFARASAPYDGLNGWRSLAGKKLLVEYQIGAAISQKNLERVIEPDMLSSVAQVEQGLRKVKAGRTDVFVSSLLNAWQAMDSPEFKGIVVPIGVMEETEVFPFMHKRHKALIPLMSKKLKEMKEEGLIEKLRRQAFKK